MKRPLLVTILVAATVLMSRWGNCGAGHESATERNYRQDMRDFIQGIRAYTKGIKPNFIVIPQNGHELLTQDAEETGTPAAAYLDAIDGVGREDLFYGYDEDDVATRALERDYMVSFLDIAENSDVEVLVTDYCSTRVFVHDAYYQNAARVYISFAADHRELDNIPDYPENPYNVHASNVTSLAEAKNFLYLINPGSFPNEDAFLDAVRETDPPSWLAEENPEWPGNYKVRYWNKDWQNIIYGKDDSYLKKILDRGFDGVYLDIIDAFEYFEDQ